MQTGQWGTWVLNFLNLSFGLARVGPEGHEGTSKFQNNLFIWMPGTEMGEQIVLLVEIKRTDKAFERPPKARVNYTLMFLD